MRGGVGKERGARLEQLRAHRATGGKVLSQARERDARAPESRLQRGLLRPRQKVHTRTHIPWTQKEEQSEDEIGYEDNAARQKLQHGNHEKFR